MMAQTKASFWSTWSGDGGAADPYIQMIRDAKRKHGALIISNGTKIFTLRTLKWQDRRECGKGTGQHFNNGYDTVLRPRIRVVCV